MVSQFQDKENLSSHDEARDNVVALMQNVLCKNFPTIPCDIITKDETLKHLIQKSIQQIKYKKRSMDKTIGTDINNLSQLPVINTDDDANMPTEDGDRPKHHTSDWTPVKAKRKKKKGKKVSLNGRKKIRKFYPHKVKQKDAFNGRNEYGHSEEKLSMSVEIPDGNNVRKTGYHSRDQPIWRIDYSKHGEPSVNVFDDRLRGKIIHAGMVEDNVLEQGPRRDVLHPDVYIKKNFVRQKVDVNSDNIE